MTEEYTSGIAFVFEGETEKVFYHTLLKHFIKKHPGYELLEKQNEKTGENFHILSSESKRTIIKVNNVGTVSQVANSGFWFYNRCYKENKSINWTVFLCYDTDSYSNDISKFHEGDWMELRKAIEKNRNCKVIDLAAQADIEDIMLLDSNSVFAFLGISPIPIPSGKKGKVKMKKIFRLKGIDTAYHEGERARPLIESLDMEKIISLSTIPFVEIENKCFF